MACGCGGKKAPVQVKRPSTPSPAQVEQGGYKQWNGPTQKGA